MMVRSIFRRFSGAFTILAVMSCPVIAAERGISVGSLDSSAGRNSWGRYHAIIVGINDYQQWPKLLTAVKDATVLKDVLVERYNFPPENVTPS